MQYKKRSGVTTIEYGILAALIAIVVIATITILGTKTNNLFCTIESKMISSTGTGTGECYKKRNIRRLNSHLSICIWARNMRRYVHWRRHFY